MSRPPSVSVIIPTWNRAATLLDAVHSALAQDHAPLEILVCDDGSEDDSRARLEALGDARVRWLAGDHSGRPAVARNRGIAESRGEWLAFLDSDDQWVPSKLREQLGLAHALGCRAACSNALCWSPDVGARGWLLDYADCRLPFARLVRSNLVVCSSALFHRSLVPFVRGFPEQRTLAAAEDYALWLRIATYTEFAFVAAPLTVYRDGAVDSIRSRESLTEAHRAQQVFADYLAWCGNLDRHALQLRWEMFKRARNARLVSRSETSNARSA